MPVKLRLVNRPIREAIPEGQKAMNKRLPSKKRTGRKLTVGQEVITSLKRPLPPPSADTRENPDHEGRTEPAQSKIMWEWTAVACSLTWLARSWNR
jgi:hypothetical protein